MSSKREFLAKLSLFQNLDEEALSALAGIATEYEFDEGAILAYQRDVADKLYIVRRGRLFARSVDERGIVRDTKSYFPGERLKDSWLFLPQTHDATLHAATEGRVLIIEHDDFLEFLHRYPEALEDMRPEVDELGQLQAGLTPEGWEEARKVRARQTLHLNEPGSLIEYYSRRSGWLLALKLLPLGFFFLLSLGAFIVLRTNFDVVKDPTATLAVLIFLTFLFGGFAVFQWLDWRNDYFVITDTHIIHNEFSLQPGKLGTMIKATPIEQVQSVEIEKPNLFSNIFDVGTARITTAAQAGVIYFDFIDDPIEVRDTITRLRRIVRDLDAGREQALLRGALESHFQVGTPYKEVVGEEPEIISAPRRSWWQRLRARYGARVVEGNTITYRRHPFVLLSVSKFPLGMVVLTLLGIGTLLFIYPIALGIFWIVPILVLLFAFGWLTWVVEDWRNDMFQLSSSYVVDIDRSPFGTGESRKQAPLGNVQNVSADRPGLLPTLFNYGNVYIDTAGANADITFENVTNPNQVQQDIFERREQLRRQQQGQEGTQRRKEIALMLDVYQQAQEQGRIPRRTPPGEIEV